MATKSSKSSKASASSKTEPADNSESAATTVAIRRKEFIARVAQRSGMKPNQVKLVMDATLAEVGDVLFRGDALNVEPLGKMQVNRHRETDAADIVVCRLRRKKPVEADPVALAEPAE